MIRKDKITVLPDSIKIPEPERKEYGQHKILFLGRLCREKGIGELLEIMPDLREKYPEVRLYLGGIWEDAGLKAEAEKHPEFITWLGWVSGEEKKRYLQMCDIFVLPSYFEGQSVSLLEAMAYSCAVAAAETGDSPDDCRQCYRCACGPEGCGFLEKGNGESAGGCGTVQAAWRAGKEEGIGGIFH